MFTLVTRFAVAVYRVGRQVQIFPFFSAERQGAPIKAYLRVDGQPILHRSPVKRPVIIVAMGQIL